jgi:hypothetical protein
MSIKIEHSRWHYENVSMPIFIYRWNFKHREVALAWFPRIMMCVRYRKHWEHNSESRTNTWYGEFLENFFLIHARWLYFLAILICAIISLPISTCTGDWAMQDLCVLSPIRTHRSINAHPPMIRQDSIKLIVVVVINTHPPMKQYLSTKCFFLWGGLSCSQIVTCRL